MIQRLQPLQRLLCEGLRWPVRIVVMFCVFMALPGAVIQAASTPSNHSQQRLPRIERINLGAQATPGELAPASPAQQARARQVVNNLPLHFEAQGAAEGGFHARGRGYHLNLQPGQLRLKLKKRAHVQIDPQTRRPLAAQPPVDAPGTVVRKTYSGANPRPQMQGEDPLSGKSHYLIGGDPSRWRKNVTQYSKVRYRNVYPGIDLLYYGNQGRVEYDWIVAPGADPHRIVETFDGASSVSIAANGDLLIQTPDGPISQKKPVLYQTIAGQRIDVPGNYVMVGALAVGFQVGKYDRSQPLIIDPVLEYSTYLGGTLADIATSVAVNAAGEVFVAGITEAPDNFQPAPGAATPGPSFSNTAVRFVIKLDASGSNYVYRTYFGELVPDLANSYYIGASLQTMADRLRNGVNLALGADGSAYIAGISQGGASPTTTIGAPTGKGALITKLNPAGDAITYSTLVSTLDAAAPVDINSPTAVAIAVDATGSVTIAGSTRGTQFPATPGTVQPNKLAPTRYDGYVAKLTPSGSALAYATLFGGADGADPGGTFVQGLAVDAAGNTIITGSTESTTLPLANTLQPSSIAGAFLAKITSGGSAITYSFNTPGAVNHAVAVDREGNAVVGGARVYKYSSTGSQQFTFEIADFNGLQGQVLSVSTDRFGNLYATGIAYVAPGSAVYDNLYGDIGLGSIVDDPARLANKYDIFVTKIAADGAWYDFFILMGGDALPNFFPDYQPGLDIGTAIAVDGNGGIYVTGGTFSPNFPVLNATQPRPDLLGQPDIAFFNGDAVLVKLSEPLGGIALSSDTNPAFLGNSIALRAFIGDSTATGTVTFQANGALLGTAPVVNGVAFFNLNATVPATYTIIANYSGDATHPVATSAPLIQDIIDGAAPLTDTVTTLSSVPAPNGKIAITATVTGNTPRGTVSFFLDKGVRVVSSLTGNSATVVLAFGSGTHSVVARYRGDARNNPSTSSTYTFSVGAPVVTITQPANGTNVQYPATITISANAQPSFGRSIASVAVLVDGTQIGAVTTPPYTFPYINGPPGPHQITAVATDNTGNQTTSSAVQVQVLLNSGITYYHQDLQGNTVMATDGTSNVVAVLYTESYLPYGERLVNDAASGVAQAHGNRLWFHGKAQDEQTGLQYFGARYYDPALGRFMGVDPQGFREDNLHSLNRFAYGNNNPLKFQDPDGRVPFLIIPIVAYIASGAVIGGGTGAAINAGLQYHKTGSVKNISGVGGVLDAAGDGAMIGAVFGVVGGAEAGVAAAVVGGVRATATNEAKQTIVHTSPKNLIPTQTKSEMSGSQVKRLAKDMKKNGYDQSQPISAQPSGPGGRLEIIDGHHRREAAIKAGIEKVPVQIHGQ